MLHAQNPFLNGNNHPFASLFNGAQQPSHPYARPTRGGFPYSNYYCQQPTRSSIPLCRHCGEAHDPRDHFYDPSSSRSAYHHPSFYDALDEEEGDAADTWTRARQRQIYEERLRQAELEKARRLAMQQERQQQYIDALRRQQQEEDEARMRYLQQRQAALEEYRRRRDEEEQLRVQATEEARKQQERRRRQAEEEQARQQRLQRLSYIRQNVAARTIQRFMRTATLLRCVNAIARRFKELKEAFVFPASIDLQDNAAAAAEPKLAYTQNNYAIHAFDDALSKLLVQLDGVESFGILAVRERRKQVVRMIESEAQALEERWKAAAKAQQQQQQQQQAEVDEEEEIRNDETAGVPSSAESVETAEDVVEEEEDHRMNTDEDGAVVPASAEQPSISESTATLSADPIVDDIVPEPTTITHESSVAAGEPTHEHEHEHPGEPTSTPIDEEVDPDEDEKSMILERTTTATSSSLSLPTHSDAHLTGTTESSTEPTEPTSIIISTSASTSITPESSATVAVNGGPVDGVLTHFDDDEPHDGLLLSSSSLPIFTPTPTKSALPIPDAPSSSSSSSSGLTSTPHLSPSSDIPFVAEDEDNENEEIEEVDRALAITPLGAEYTSTEEEEREGEEEEETWEDAWEELMPLDGDLDGVSARFSSTSSAAAAAIAMHQPESANEETWSTTSSEKAQEQTRISLLPASKDGEEPEGAEDFEMV